jgi:glycerophosphoryl diester phosphodiesterase
MMKIILLVTSFFLSVAWAFDWQGHRGARGLFPENSLEGMRLALEYPITTLEFDVVISRDKKVLLSHEPWMSEEICLGPKSEKIKERVHNLYQMDYQQISEFDCGSKLHPRFPEQKKQKVVKPLLKTVIETVQKEYPDRKISYNIEIKSTPEDEDKGFQPPYTEFTDLVITELASMLKPEEFFIQSFDFRVLRYLHKKYPDIKTVALIEKSMQPKKMIKTLGFVPTVFSPYYKFLKKDDVLWWQQKGAKVIPWTVNDLKDLKAVKALGVDGIITDYPNRIPQVP